MEHFDLIVIGAGPGGYQAALEATKYNKKVMLIEYDKLGGTCLNRGCIPTKALLRSANLYKEAKNGTELGVETTNTTYNFDNMCKHSTDVKNKLRDGIASLIKRNKVTYAEGVGQIVDEHTVKVNNENYSFDNLIIASGSVPYIPDIPGNTLKNVITSDDLLTDEGINLKSIVIVGGGAIGVEFAQIYNDLGAEVTIIVTSPRLLSSMDKELGQSLGMIFKKRGINLYVGASLSNIEEKDNKLSCTFEDKNGSHNIDTEYVLLCKGRKANTKDLFLNEELKEKLNLQKGCIPTDINGRTNIKNIWAIGDVTLKSTQLAHAAEAQGKNVVSAMFGVLDVKDTRFIPGCIFTNPEISSVGLTLEEAKEQGIEAKSKKNLSTSNGKAMIDGADRGFIKFVYRTSDNVVIGAHIMCPHSSEMIGGITAMMRKEFTVDDISKTIFPHPTVSEIIGE